MSRLASFPYPSRSQTPCAGRHTSASSVHRVCPPPCQPGLPLTGFQFTLPRCCTGLPVLPRFPSSAHADASTPVGTARCSCRLPSRAVNGLPLITGGSAHPIDLFEACSAFIQIPACAVAELLNATLCRRSASNHLAPSIVRPGCTQPKTTIVG